MAEGIEALSGLLEQVRLLGEAPVFVLLGAMVLLLGAVDSWFVWMIAVGKLVPESREASLEADLVQLQTKMEAREAAHKQEIAELHARIARLELDIDHLKDLEIERLRTDALARATGRRRPPPAAGGGE